MNVYRVEFDLKDCHSELYPFIPTMSKRECLFIKAENEQDATFYAGMTWMEQFCVQGFKMRWEWLGNISVQYLEKVKE